MKRQKIFVSYSHRDKKLFDEFKTMLAPAIRKGIVDIWDDTQIAAGAKWKEEIETALAAAKIAVLLVSPDFLASEFIAKHELPPLLDAAKKEGVTIYWIYLSHCLYEETEIANYQAAHDVSKPLVALTKSKRQAVLSETCHRLIALVEDSIHQTSVEENSPVRPASLPSTGRRRSPHDYVDDLVSSVAARLEESKPLTMHTLVREFNELFKRGTFRWEALRECYTQEWGYRLHAAMQTLELLRRYSSTVSELAPETHSFEMLMDEVNGYCLSMASNLFDATVEVSRMRRLVGTNEFEAALPKATHFDMIDDQLNEKVDGTRLRAIAQMDNLLKEFRASADPVKSVNAKVLDTWLERLAYLQQQEAIVADAAQRFQLKKQIEEAQAKIAELGG